MNYETVGFMLTRKCNASCRMCCISSDPHCTEKLDTLDIKKYILSTKDVPGIRGISFTGGEPFLYYSSLKDLILYAVEAGKQVTVITNGFWASDYDDTEQRLEELKELGLKVLGISYDEFHREYVPVQNIKNILRAANSLDLPITINTILLKTSSMGALLDDLGEDIVDVRFIPFSCMPVGKAKNEIPYDQYIRHTSPKGCACRKGGVFSIDYKGDIYPCCSPYVYETQLCIGNYSEMDVQTTLKKIKNNHILYMLRRYGFDYFLDIAENKLHIEIPETLISPCELCSLFFRKENIVKFYPYIYETLEELRREKEADTSLLYRL